MFSQYMEDLEKKPYVVEDFVEKLFWRASSVSSDSSFDPQNLTETFNQTIKDLKILQERQQRKCEKLELALKEEEKVHAKNIDEILEQHQISIDCFHHLVKIYLITITLLKYLFTYFIFQIFLPTRMRESMLLLVK